jgi:hypothetical protein
MAIRERPFSREKCLEALLLIVAECGPVNVWDVLRVRYQADKAHLSAYGFLASGDQYVVTEHGATARNTLAVLQSAWGALDGYADDRRFISLLKGSLLVEPPGGKDRVKAHRQPDLSYLGDSEIEALREAATSYVQLSELKRELVAKDSAWEQAMRTGGQGFEISVDAIARTLVNAEEILAYLDA